MKKLFLLFFILILFLSIAGWAVFALIKRLPELPQFILPVEYEEKLGEVMVSQMLLNQPGFREIKNPSADSALHLITSRLVNHIGQTEYHYQFHLVENPEVNAFTLPGGHIFIFSGLIAFSNQPEETAAVLSHEIGHVEKRHVVTKIFKELGLTFLIGIFTTGDFLMFTEIGRTLLSTVFDREQEREADQFGLDLLARSGIHPHSMATFFKRLENEKGTYPQAMEILMTHPHTDTRVEASMAYQLPETFKQTGFDINWDTIKESLTDSLQK